MLSGMSIETLGDIMTIVFGGGLVTTLWNWNANRLAEYRMLDDAYRELLAQYRARFALGDPAATSRYEDAFSADQQVEYHYFAMSVHNTLETIFDVVGLGAAKDRMWGRIFEHHARLHYAWLLKNTSAFEERYVEYVKDMLGPLPAVAETTTAPQIVNVSDLAAPVATRGEPPHPEQTTEPGA